MGFATQRRRRGERGTAALELGLVSPFVFAILFGIVSYGLWLNDAMNLRQGLREASRQAVVGNYGTSSTCTTGWQTVPSTNVKKIVCSTRGHVAALIGDVTVRVELPGGWVRGEELVVCAMVEADSLPSLVPLPSDRVITSQSRMSIEAVAPGQVETAGGQTPPSGTTWDWCG